MSQILVPGFDGATLKLKRAESHIDEFKSLVDILGSSDKPVSISRDSDGRYVAKFTDLGENGQQIPMIMGDAIHNLRTALDHVWTALDRAATGKDTTFATFPFHQTRQNLKDAIEKSAVKVAFPDVERLILDQIKTHSDAGGDHKLWSLTKLDKLDKHNTIIPTLIVRKVPSLTLFVGGGKFTFTDCDFSEIGDLVNSTSEPKFECNGKITIEPVFPDGLTVSGERVIETLSYMSQATRKAVELFRETFL